MRRPLSTTARVKLFADHKGVCHLCGNKIEGKGWDVEHVIPLAMGGDDDVSNMRPAHRTCHKAKSQKDVAEIAKAKRREARALGAHRPRKGFRGWRRFNGDRVWREDA